MLNYFFNKKLMANLEKIEIEQKTDYMINDNIDGNGNQSYKLNFDFDILNEPMPDFNNQNKNDHFFLNIRNYAYKRKYNEIQNNYNTYSIKPYLKVK